MEKRGVSSQSLIDSLRQEESALMMEMADYMSAPLEKKSGIDRDAIETRLSEVRQKITEVDLKNLME